MPESTSLVISGDGSLEVYGGRNGGSGGGAGIGADRSGSLGSITISSGTITATARNGGGAGIGMGGWDGSASGSAVTITGGHVTASAAAGDEGSFTAASITITGGIVEVPDNKLNRAEKNNCIVFSNGNGQVYGTFTLTGDFTVESGKSLTVSEGATLDITPHTLTNSGTLTVEGTVNGTLTNNGTLTVEGTVNGTLTNNGTITAAGTIDGTLTNNGAITVTGTIDGTIDNNDTITVAGTVSGTLTNNGVITVTGAITGTLDNKNGTIFNAGTIPENIGGTVIDSSNLPKTVEYIDDKGDRQTADNVQSIIPGTEKIDLTGGTWYAVYGSIEWNSSVTVQGNVHLILTDSCALTVNGGILVQGDGSSLTIYAQSTDEAVMGALTATSGGAGIYCSTGQVLTINGGSVTATGGSGAGIGGGYGAAGGVITVNGGIVTAKSTGGGAGIGGGSGGGKGTSDKGGAGGAITINGGTVTATSTGAAGIGGGYGGMGRAPGYAGGYGSNSGGAGGTITITGGRVTATGGSGAGIGGGNGDPPGEGGIITIWGGTVTANGGSGGAGIGGGGGISYDEYGTSGSAGGTITITGGTVTANGSTTGSGVGAGIGGGAGSNGSVRYWGGEGGNGGEITITGGTVAATGGSSNGPDIGGGRGGRGGSAYGQKPVANTDKIEIGSDATVTNGSGGKPNYGPAHGMNSSKWAYDETEHWHPCFIDNCTKEDHKFGKESHNVDDQNWVWDNDQHWYGCTICGAALHDVEDHDWIGSTCSTCHATRAAAPNVTINYAAETLSTTTDMEYSTNNGSSWTTCGENMSPSNFGWRGSQSITVQFRTKATDSACASEAQLVTIPARPNRPSVQAVDATSAGNDGRITGVDDTMEYRKDSEGTWTPCTGGEIIGLAAGTYLIRYKATETTFASDGVYVTVRAAAPEQGFCLNEGGIEIYGDGNGGIVVEQNGAEYTVSNGEVRITGNGDSTSNTIFVRDVTAHITLSNVKQDSDRDYPLIIFESNVRLTLEGNNTMLAENEAIYVEAWKSDSKLTIDGPGTLTIGSAKERVSNGIYLSYSGSVTIDDGVLNIYAQDAAIGGDYDGSLTVNGGAIYGDVSGRGRGYSGLGVSGSPSGDSMDITINGGTVELTGSNDQIYTSDSNPAVITGGSVTAGGVTPAPTNGTGPVYAVTVEGIGSGTVDAFQLKKDDAVQTYGAPARTTTDGKVILYLPEGAYSGTAIVGGKLVNFTCEASSGDTGAPSTVTDTGITITTPEEEKPTINDNGTVEVPDGSKVQTGDNGPVVTLPGGGTVDGGNGTVTVPDGGTVQVGNPATTITPPNGEPVIPSEGGVTVPGGSTVKPGDGGPEITVGDQGGSVGGDGGVTVPGGGKVTVKDDSGDITITLPSGGGTVKPNPDGTISLPGGATVEKGGETITVPGGGGTYHPDTGKVTENNSGGGYIPPSTPTYPPTVEKPSEGGGTPAISPSNPKQGDTVTVTPKPDTGYEVDKITVTNRNGKPVEVTKKPDGTYTFKQPSGKVTIKVTYQPIDRPWNNPFADVSEGDWYYEAVQFVQERGLMIGYSDGRFGPNDTLSRAQLAQILFNKEGRPGVNYLMDFSDVAGEAWYTEAIRWATSQGIVGGYGNGTFGPNDPINREQLAVMLWRHSSSPAATNKELHFNDESEISGFALEALRWAVENGILNGYGDGRLGPQGQATRAQVAQMLKNFIENQEEENT